MNRPVVWWIGEVHRREWQAVRLRLEQPLIHLPQTTLCDLSAVELQLQQAPPPDLVLVCQSWPDEFPSSHVGRLLAAVPLARVVCLAGDWCEAIGRTRQHWPPALIAPRWLAVARVAFEIEVLCGRIPALPWTATRDEFIEHRCKSVPDARQVMSAGRLALDHSEQEPQARLELFDPALRTEFTQQLAELGWQVIQDAGAEVSAIFVQAEPASAERYVSIAEHCRAAAPARVIAVTTWPLPEYCEQLRATGVYAIVNPLEPDNLRELFRPSRNCQRLPGIAGDLAIPLDRTDP